MSAAALLLVLGLPCLAALLARRAARALGRTHPATATWCLTLLSVGIGFATCLGIASVAADLLLLRWSSLLPAVLVHLPPGSLATCALVLGAALLAVTGALPAGCAAARDWWAAHRALGDRPAGGVLLLSDDAPEAYAVAGPRSVVVVHTGLFDLLAEVERAVVVAHEQAHLARHHGVHVLAARTGAVLNPLLRPLVHAVHESVERWADEDAADRVGDRAAAARTVARASLARRRASTGGGHLAMSQGGAAARAAALVRPRPPDRRAAVLAVIASVVAVNLAVGDAAHGVEDGYERLRRSAATSAEPSATTRNGRIAITVTQSTH
ncbi:peptidase M48-like protein [Motilibacter peucedani]|uniref:Peptidase M48-like protein n=1 Tax=Motilibacter peucedani TaxID=598650 RepID=A0A420XTS0_9ACTN|nr:M56 family metallopeptidase [Motilibacter peucedani]RKS80049.1 peptidase M48-like protein [Motilibacter peucedani]